MNNDKNNIYYSLSGCLNTDGDYYLSEDMISQPFGHIFCDNEEYVISYSTTYKNDMRDYLEKLIVSLRVVYTHYWVLINLSKCIEELLNALLDDSKDTATFTYGGNYEGTKLTLRKVRYA